MLALAVIICEAVAFTVEAGTDALYTLQTRGNLAVRAEEGLVAHGLVGVADFGDVLFVGHALDVLCEVNLFPPAVQVDDAPGVAVIIEAGAGNAQLTAHNGEDVHKVEANACMGIVYAPGTAPIFVIVVPRDFCHIHLVAVIG